VVPLVELGHHAGRADQDARAGLPHLTEDLANHAITWIRTQKSIAPTKPFMMDFAPGATHASHQVAPEWISVKIAPI